MKKNSLQENSRSYHSEANIYEKFSEAEDSPGKLFKFLESKVKGKTVLDVGCGGGRFISKLAPSSKKYISVDISKEQIKKAKAKATKLKNIKFIRSSAEDRKMVPSKSIEIVIATWVISVIRGFRRRKRVLKEIKEDGEVYLIENDSSGEFEIMRGHLKNTERYNKWLEKNGFKKIKINTYFKFKSLEDAKNIFYAI